MALDLANRTAVELFADPALIVDADPLANLVGMLESSARMQRVFEIMLAEDPSGTMLETVDYGKAGGLPRGGPVPYLKLYAQWTDRTAKISKLALDAGVAQRQLKMAGDQAAMVVDAIYASSTNSASRERIGRRRGEWRRCGCGSSRHRARVGRPDGK